MGSLKALVAQVVKLLLLMALFASAFGCVKEAPNSETQDPQARFVGIGAVLVVDATPGAEMEGVVFQDDRGYLIFSSATVSKRNRSIMALGGTYIPRTVRATWGKSRQYDFGSNSWYGGEITGDYIVPVAQRIPDEILNDIRARRGNLRLKFRLTPNGVLFGWDIERAAPLGDVSIFEEPGGDFLETRY